MIKIIPNEATLLISTKKQKILVIPDLHIGFEKEFAEKGISLPSQTEKIFERILSLLKKHKPERLIFLGDVKHGTTMIMAHEWKEIPKFFEKLRNIVKEVEIIPGNHDGDLQKLLPGGVRLTSPNGIIVLDGKKKISLIHGHAWPGPETFSCDELIMGHHHFTIMLKDVSGLRVFEPIWFITKWDRTKIARSYLRSRKGRNPLIAFRKNFNISVKTPRIIVMPTFNRMLGGIAINQDKQNSGSEYLGPIFNSGAIDMKNSELYLLDGTYLGRLNQLKHAK